MVDAENRTIEIYGFSYSFGQANHEISAETVRADDRYANYHITTSNEGY
jgi:hypothetical protein